MASKAKLGAGTKLKLGNAASPEVFTAVVEIKTVKIAGSSVKTAEITNMDSPVQNGKIYEEFLATIAAGGDVDFTYNWIPSDSGGQAAFITAFDGQVHNWQIVSPIMNTSNSPATNYTVSFAAIVTTCNELEFDLEKAIVGTGKLKISGPFTIA